MPTHFVKLGGSLITDKNRPITPRLSVIQRLAQEIATAMQARPELRLVLSHGSGSYGHHVGRQYRTREGVHDAAGWQGFVETAQIAAQLHRLVLDALLAAGVKAFSCPPSVLARCRDGQIVTFHVEPVLSALACGLTPVVYGDVAFDETLGGTIVSTEQVLAALTPHLRPGHLSLVGLVDGVFDADPTQNPDAQPLPHITLAQVPQLAAGLGGSHGIDVTGGMSSKIRAMAELLQYYPDLRVHLLSGEIPDHVHQHLLDPEQPLGTTMTA